jgi:SAM-dependent methyltransferase
MNRGNAEAWDEWWTVRLSRGRDNMFFPVLPAPIFEFRGQLWDVPNNDDPVVHIMREHGLRTVLCAGNGVSQEPRALAAAGFDVTALDISPVAVRHAENYCDDAGYFACLFCSPALHRPGGSVSFIIGDLLNAETCPGPFDVVIERRTVQVFAEHERDAALSALSRRLSDVGVFLSLCLDDPFPAHLGWSQHESGLFHASEPWFREHGWVIWDGLPNSALAGRVAWLIRAGSGKRRPEDNDTGR